MSFNVNNVAVDTAYFNGSEVKSIYYNNTLVWEYVEMPAYEELEYIQSSGTQYIDTGFKPNNNTRVVIDVSDIDTDGWSALFGTRDAASASAANMFNLANTTGSTFITDYFGTRQTFTVSDKASRQIIDKNKNITKINGQTITNTAVSSAQCSYPLYLFVLNSVGSPSEYGMYKLYACQIYDNGTLVRDFVPAKLSSTGEVGLIDKVTKQFYGNKGTGSFSYSGAFEWVGWSSATWEDVYNLCKAKQSGEITAWPSDVVLGATKTVTLSTAVLGTSSTSVRIIGLDHDGSGTITFQTVNTLATKTKWTSDTGAGTAAYYSWDNSQVRVECQNFYNYCEAKPYIKTVSKQTYYISGGSSGYLENFTETVFLLSQSEVFYSGLSEGNQYGYYDTEVPNKAYWLRSTRDGSYKNAMKTTTDGDTDYSGKTTTEYISPAFVIG